MNHLTAERRDDIDWLRVLATLLVVVFHVGMVFNPAPFYHIRNDQLSFAALVACGFIGLWHMPLFFVLAGWSLARSIGSRGVGEVMRERLRRIGVPLVAGVLLYMPWIKYIELRSGMDLNHRGLWVTEALQPGFREIIPGGLPTMPEFREPLGTFLPTFFTQLDRFTWAHLWFLAYLLTFTILLLPLFRRWAKRPLSSAPPPRWLVFAPMLLLALIQWTLRPYWPGIQNLYDDWANVAWYTTFLCAGFALGRDPRLEAMVHEQWRLALALGLAACGVLLGGVLGAFSSPDVLLVGSAVAAWCFVIAILGAGRRQLSFSTPTLRYLAEAALPLYVLHQAAIVIPGWFIVALPLGIPAKFLLLLAVAFGLIFAVYHFILRPLQPLRLLFGMRPLMCPVPRVRAAAPIAAAVGLFVGGLGAPPVHATASPIGTWYVEGGAAKVQVDMCGDALCGRIVWLRSPFDDNGCILTDHYNSDPALQGREMVGIEILRGLRAAGTDVWSGGSIYDPTSGRTYRCDATLDGANRMHVRGYLGWRILGRTTTWVRVGSERSQCLAAAGSEGVP